ncbi:MAG TPA: hypothetical protein VKA85_03790 [Candidatus Limnocylindrales bacterium]|nr:hypothetical protein [Candidatus Limnocylindrales bacterium]
MDQLHQLLAWLVVGATAALLGAAIVTAIGRTRSYRLLDAAILGQLVAALVSVGSGLTVLPSGAPADPLHLVYAIVAIVVAPGVRYATRHRDAAGMGRWQIVAAVVVLAVVVRLFMTGR